MKGSSVDRKHNGKASATKKGQGENEMRTERKREKDAKSQSW